jgi:hypothetical protein
MAVTHEFRAQAQEANRIAAQMRGGNRVAKAAPSPRWPTAPAAHGKLTALTPVQIEILAFMREYLAENDQLPPVAQVGAKFGFHTNGAQWHLAELGRKGALEKNAAGRWRFARGDTRTGDLFEGVAC